MTKVVANKESFSSAINKMKKTSNDNGNAFATEVSNLFSSIRNGASHRVSLSDSCVSDDYPSSGEPYDYSAQASAYNGYMAYIVDQASEEAANSIVNDLRTGMKAIEEIEEFIDDFESCEEINNAITALNKSVENLGDTTYGEIYYYDSDGEVGGTEDPSPSPSPKPGINDNSGQPWNDDTTEADEVDFSTFNPDDTQDQDDTHDGDEGNKDNLNDEDTGDADTTHDGDEGNKDNLNDEDTGDADSTHDQDGTADASLEDMIGTSIDELTDSDQTGHGGHGGAGTGAGELDDWESAAAGAGALMLGLTGFGTGEGDDNYLENLANGFDDSRTLADMGLDVFDHPDYISEENPDMMAQEFGNALEAEEGEIDPDSLDGFNIKAAADLEGQESSGNQNNALGAGALAGAAAVGALAAGGLIGADEANGGLFDGGAGIGPDGRYQENKKSLNDMFFGSNEDEDDEEEKQKQLMRERIAMIATASSLAASGVTFGLANADMISPFWFMIAILLLAASMLYFNLVIDKKNKRREELQAKKNVTGRKSFFGGNNQLPVPEESPGKKEVDWILFGMVMLSTSSFILKTYDVISWLLFIILLILFVLIIFAYIILKKKLGENDKKGPYLK